MSQLGFYLDCRGWPFRRGRFIPFRAAGQMAMMEIERGGLVAVVAARASSRDHDHHPRGLKTAVSHRGASALSSFTF
jgi:hypothetical protein